MTVLYEPGEAKDWARAHFRGACNVVLPSYSADLHKLNEPAIRLDVARNRELGFWGALLVSETATTVDEYVRFMEIAVDEAAGRQHFLMHASFDTLETALAVADAAHSIGVTGMLVSYPNSFYPRTVAELGAYTRALCEGVDLATVLFCAPHFNLGRLHPSGFPIEVWLDLVDVPTVVAVKYEVGQPGVVGSWQCFRTFAERGVLVCDPYEPNLLLWAERFGTPWVGTSNYEYLGATVPLMLADVDTGRWDAATERYWRVQPARRARERLRVQAAGANFNHRYLWKFQAWLQGYNGGPLRAPAPKLSDEQMQAAAGSLVASGLLAEVPKDLGSFFVGRHPI